MTRVLLDLWPPRVGLTEGCRRADMYEGDDPLRVESATDCKFTAEADSYMSVFAAGSCVYVFARYTLGLLERTAR